MQHNHLTTFLLSVDKRAAFDIAMPYARDWYIARSVDSVGVMLWGTSVEQDAIDNEVVKKRRAR